MDYVVSVPSWAFDFCYYYLALSALVLVSTVYIVFKLLLLSPSERKHLPLPVTYLVLFNLMNGVVTVVLGMMQFWICRSALAPTQNQNQKQEGFLNKIRAQHKKDTFVDCATTEDCQKAVGNKSPSCTCGARGLCAGCNYTPSIDGSGDYPAWDSF